MTSEDPFVCSLDTRRWADRYADLSEWIALLAAQIQVATYHLLCLIRVFDEIGGAGGLRFKSTAQWLAWRTGIRVSTARGPFLILC